MSPRINPGEYVFTSINDLKPVHLSHATCIIKEEKGTTLIIERQKADDLNLKYNFVSNWITLQIHSPLDAVGLTAIFSTELANNNISCNVVAGFYHDHIFVSTKNSKRAIEVLEKLSESYS